MARKTVKELNVVVEALEERLKGFKQVAKLLQNININDIVRKLEKVDALEKKVESMDENVKKDATNVEEIASDDNQIFKCRRCDKKFAVKNS